MRCRVVEQVMHHEAWAGRGTGAVKKTHQKKKGAWLKVTPFWDSPYNEGHDRATVRESRYRIRGDTLVYVKCYQTTFSCSNGRNLYKHKGVARENLVAGKRPNCLVYVNKRNAVKRGTLCVHGGICREEIMAKRQRSTAQTNLGSTLGSVDVSLHEHSHSSL